jgi:sugar lactone lactonase YvrE
VIRVDPDTGTQTVLSTGGAFSNPFAIALEADGDILVLDNLAANFDGAVIRVDAETGDQTVVSTGGFFNDPGGIAVAADGDILVADYNAFGFGGPLGSKPGGVIRIDPDTGEQTVLSSEDPSTTPPGSWSVRSRRTHRRWPPVSPTAPTRTCR